MRAWHAGVVCMVLLAAMDCASDEDGSATASATSASGGAGGAAGSAGGATTGGPSSGGSGATGAGPVGGAPGNGGFGAGPPPFMLEVACGASICTDATPVCCVSPQSSACAAYMGSLSCPDGSATLFCDDSGDCLAGQICCVDAGASAGGVYSCAYAPCATHEACTPGGTCDQAGFSCVDDAQQASGAKCVQN